MNTSSQLKARIKNLSKERGVTPEILLRSFMMERLLERMSLSEFSEYFILKGGMLVAAIVGIDAWSTMDMDTTITGFNISEARLKAMVNHILKLKIDDGVTMKLIKVESIREAFEYEGFRLSILAQLDKTKQMIKVDVTV